VFHTIPRVMFVNIARSAMVAFHTVHSLPTPYVTHLHRSLYLYSIFYVN